MKENNCAEACTRRGLEQSQSDAQQNDVPREIRYK